MDGSLKWFLTVAEKGVDYEFRIAGRNHIGYGQEAIKYLLTPEGAPNGPPINISYRFQTPDVVCVTWSPPAKEHRNGQITYFDIQFNKKIDHTTSIDRNTTQTKVKDRGNTLMIFPHSFVFCYNLVPFLFLLLYRLCLQI